MKKLLFAFFLLMSRLMLVIATLPHLAFLPFPLCALLSVALILLAILAPLRTIARYL